MFNQNNQPKKQENQTAKQFTLFSSELPSNSSQNTPQLNLFNPANSGKSLFGNPLQPSLFSGLANNQNSKQEGKPKTEQTTVKEGQSSSNPSSLFGTTSGLFGNMANTMAKQQEKKSTPDFFNNNQKTSIVPQVQIGGLFGSKDQSNLTNKNLGTSLFGGIKDQSSNPTDKNLGTSLFGGIKDSLSTPVDKTLGNSLFGNPSDKNLGTSLFGGIKDQSSNPADKNPGTNLFGGLFNNPPKVQSKSNENTENNQVNKKNQQLGNFTSNQNSKQKSPLSPFPSIFTNKQSPLSVFPSIFANKQSVVDNKTTNTSLEYPSLFQGKYQQKGLIKQTQKNTQAITQTEKKVNPNPISIFNNQSMKKTQQKKVPSLFSAPLSSTNNDSTVIPPTLTEKKQTSQFSFLKRVDSFTIQQNQQTITVPEQKNKYNSDLPVIVQQDLSPKPIVKQNGLFIQPISQMQQSKHNHIKIPQLRIQQNNNENQIMSNKQQKPAPIRKKTTLKGQDEELSPTQIINLYKMTIASNDQLHSRSLDNHIKSIENAIISVFTLKELNVKLFEYQESLKPQLSRIHQNQTLNKFYNDLVEMLKMTEYLTPKSNKTLISLLNKLIKQKNLQNIFYPNKVVNEGYLNDKIYKEETISSQILNQDSKQLLSLINALTKEVQSFRITLLEIIDFSPRILNKSPKVYETLLLYCIRRSAIPYVLENQFYIENIMNTRNQTVKECLRLLLKWGNQFNVRDNIKQNKIACVFDISGPAIAQCFQVIDQLRNKDTIQLFERIILLLISTNEFSIVFQKNQIRQAIFESKQIHMLPFKYLVDQNFFPHPKNLFAYVRGPQWIYWLELYLKNHSQIHSQPLQINQIPQIVEVIKSFDQFVASRILKKGSVIYKFIYESLKQQNEVVLLFDVLSSLIFNSDTIDHIQMLFFSNASYTQYYNKSLVREIQSQSFNQQPQVTKAKLSYILKTIIYDPERVDEYQQSLFDNLADENQNASEKSCHRLCLFLIDLIKYYSQNYATEMLAKIFQAITSILRNSTRKKFMIAALNVHKPQLTFLDKCLTPHLTNAINQHLQFILDDRDFYFSLSSLEQQALPLFNRAHVYRNTQQYNRIFSEPTSNKYLTTVYPSYWVAHLIHLASKQQYNPQIIESLLSKLIIFPQPMKKSIQVPFLINCIVQNINNIKFQQTVMQFIEVIANERKNLNEANNTVDLFNKKIIENYVLNYRKVFFTIRLIKTVLILHRIYERYSITCSKHFIISALSKLQCIEKLYKLILNQGSQQQINPILSIFSLINFESKMVNLTITDSNIWEYLNSTQEYTLNFIEKKQQDLAIIDRFAIKNFLSFSKNRYLESMESLKTLSFDILAMIVTDCPKISIQGCMGIQIKSQKSLRGKTKSVIINYTQKVVDILQQKCIFTQEAILKFLLCCQKSKNNRSLSNSILNIYLEKNKQPFSSIRLNSLLTNLIQHQYQQISPEGSLPNREEIIHTTINAVIQEKFQVLSQLSLQYSQNIYPLLTFHQLQRIDLEREIMKTADMYIWLASIINIVQIMIFVKKINAPRYTSMLINFIVRNRMVCLDGEQDKNVDEWRLQLPRVFKVDTLQYHIRQLSKIQRHSQSQLIQIQNIVQWSLCISAVLKKTLSNFLLMVMSIDKTFYSNLPITFSTYQFPELFCHMHLGKINFSAIQLMGKTQIQALHNVREIADIVICRLQKVIYNEQVAIRILTSCINWLNARGANGPKVAIQLSHHIFAHREGWLRDQIQDEQESALLLCLILTLKKIPQQFVQEIQQTIDNTIKSEENLGHIRQQLISLFNIIPPSPQQQERIQMVVNMWCDETHNQFFYNESIVMILFARKYPLAIAKCSKPLMRCQKIKRIVSNSRVRYKNLERQCDNISWIWTMKIVATMALYHQNSIMVAEEVINFLDHHQRRLIQTLSQIVVLSKECYAGNVIPIQYAYLQELNQTLQLLTAVFTIQVFANIKRPLFQQILYVLTHKTINLFSGSCNIKKKYSPTSQNQILNNKIYYQKNNADFNFQSNSFYTNLSQSMSEEYQNLLSTNTSNAGKISMFNLAMQLKYYQTLKSFILCVSLGLQKSQYIDRHFQQESIQNNYRYAISYWDRINKSIIDIGRSILNILNKLKNISSALDDVLTILNDCYKTPKTSVSNGYLNTTLTLAKDRQELLFEFKEMSLLLSELAYIHLHHECRYKKSSLNLLKSHLEGYKKKTIQMVNDFDEEFKNVQDNELDANCFQQIKQTIQAIYIQ